MNNRMTRAVVIGLVLAGCVDCASAQSVQPGVARATGGATDAVTSPVRVVEGISQDTAAYGPVGVVTGTVKGGARAAGQLVTGAMNVGVGIVEALTAPLTPDK